MARPDIKAGMCSVVLIFSYMCRLQAASRRQGELGGPRRRAGPCYQSIPHKPERLRSCYYGPWRAAAMRPSAARVCQRGRLVMTLCEPPARWLTSGGGTAASSDNNKVDEAPGRMPRPHTMLSATVVMACRVCTCAILIQELMMECGHLNNSI